MGTIGRNIVLLILNALALAFSTKKMLAWKIKKTYTAHNNFLSELSHTIKIQNFEHQNWSDFFVEEPEDISLPD